MNEYINIEKITYIDKDYDKALKLLNNENVKDNMLFKDLKAYVLFNQTKYEDAALVYAELEKYYEIGVCYMLRGNTLLALDFFRQATASPAQNWAKFFCELFCENITTTPTYLQVRAFLERDLSLFLKLELVDYVQKIIDISEYLSDVNPDANKYIAKAFLYNEYYDYALEFLNRSFNNTQKDAELYYLKALYYIKSNNLNNAKIELNSAINLNKNYIPAKILLENLF